MKKTTASDHFSEWSKFVYENKPDDIHSEKDILNWLANDHGKPIKEAESIYATYHYEHIQCLSGESSNITKACGIVLVLAGDLAKTIRMNSAYNGGLERYSNDTHLAVMELSDAMHNLHRIGNALIRGDKQLIKQTFDEHIHSWLNEDNINRIEKACRVNMPDGKPLFNFRAGVISLRDRVSKIGILNEIRY